MEANKPQTVLLAAAKVGGIVANDSWPADFPNDNLGHGMPLFTAPSKPAWKSCCSWARPASIQIAPQPIMGTPC